MPKMCAIPQLVSAPYSLAFFVSYSDGRVKGLKLPNWEARIAANGLFSMRQISQLTDKGYLHWHSGESKGKEKLKYF